MEKEGTFSFVFHSHIHYVTPPDRFPHEINRLHKATAECYIPLLNTLSRLVDDGISPKATVGFTPLLTEMLTHDDYREEFATYLEERVTAAERDMGEFEKLGKKHLTMMARMWREFYSLILRDLVEQYDGNIIRPFAELQEAGHIEIITSGATSGYLPLLGRYESVQAQVKQAVACHTQHFGVPPRGFWLPEQAYRSGSRNEGERGGGSEIEDILSENGIEYLITDTHLLRGGEPLGASLADSPEIQGLWKEYGGTLKGGDKNPERSPYRPFQLVEPHGGREPLHLLTRDPLTWKAVAGLSGAYPSDDNYLDYHRRQLPSGLRYWRVTGDSGDLIDKDEYHPDNAFSSITDHVDHFTALVKETLEQHKKEGGEAGTLLSLFDATLFGQRWFEGPEWLYHAVASLAQEEEIELVTAGGSLEKRGPAERVVLAEGSWTGCGNHRIWQNDSNRWLWQRLHEAEDEMAELMSEYGMIDDSINLGKALRQGARELLLMQSADWPALLNSPAGRGYGQARFIRHFEDFKRLAAIARHVGREGALRKNDWAFLQHCEERDDIFSDVDPLWFSRVKEDTSALEDVS